MWRRVAPILVAAVIVLAPALAVARPAPDLRWLEGEWSQRDKSQGCSGRPVAHVVATFFPIAGGVLGRIELVYSCVVRSVPVAEYIIKTTTTGATLELKEGGRQSHMDGIVSEQGMRFQGPGRRPRTIVIELDPIDLVLRIPSGRVGDKKDDTYLLWGPLDDDTA